MAVEQSLLDPQQIQGNILRAFRHDHQAFVALSFGHRRAAARQWLAAVARRVSATDDAGSDRDVTDPPLSLLNVGLTATGLVLLHPETAGPLTRFTAFWQGPLGTRLDDAGRLTTAPALLGDVGPSDPRGWLLGGPGDPVDALLTISAGDDGARRHAIRRELREAADAGLTVLTFGGAEAQLGDAIYLDGDPKQRAEHFGFADGVSQPGIKGYWSRPGSIAVAAGEFILGHPGERRPVTWAPRPTPPPWMRNGSFQVFRRLSQNVARWRERVGPLGSATAEQAIGRRHDGTPLASGAKGLNDFDYRSDPSGARTPLDAHIRKMNPRDDDVFRDRGHKMLRRGITFGPRFEVDADAERGVLFNAYMASIEDQFEFVQRHWAHDPRFPSSTLAKYHPGQGLEDRVDGVDRLLGGDALITTTGAVYAFAPSRSALHRLAGRDALES